MGDYSPSAVPTEAPPVEYGSVDIAVAVLPKIFSVLSFAGSLFIVQHVLSSRKRRSAPYHRLLLGMSISDCIGNLVFFAGTWPIPKESNVYGAMGTEFTCTVQGFFDQIVGTATPGYNIVLSIYYLLVVRYGWNEHRVKRVEPYMHAYPIILSLSTAIAGIPLKLYNNATWLCWVAPLPSDCTNGLQSGYFDGEDIPCERGENAYIFRWAFLYAPLWAGFFVTAGCMFLVYGAVLRTEKRLDKYLVSPTGNGSSSNSERKRKQKQNRKNSRKVATQGLYYVGAFFFTWIFATLSRIFQLAQSSKQMTDFAFVMLSITIPLQGLFNVFIYLRPRYDHYKKKHKELSFLQICFKIARKSMDNWCFWSFCFCNKRPVINNNENNNNNNVNHVSGAANNKQQQQHPWNRKKLTSDISFNDLAGDTSSIAPSEMIHNDDNNNDHSMDMDMDIDDEDLDDVNDNNDATTSDCNNDDVRYKSTSTSKSTNQTHNSNNNGTEEEKLSEDDSDIRRTNEDDTTDALMMATIPEEKSLRMTSS